MDDGGRITLRFASLRSFLAEYGARISPEGVLLSEQPPAAGSRVELEVRLADGLRLLRARGETLWRGPVAALAGMEAAVVRFAELDEASRTLLERIVDRRRRQGLEEFRLGDLPRVRDLTVPAVAAFPEAEAWTAARPPESPGSGDVFDLAGGDGGPESAAAPLGAPESEPEEPAAATPYEPDWELEPAVGAETEDVVEPEPESEEPGPGPITEAFPPSFVSEIEAELGTRSPEPEIEEVTEPVSGPAAVTPSPDEAPADASFSDLETASREVGFAEPPAAGAPRKRQPATEEPAAEEQAAELPPPAAGEAVEIEVETVAELPPPPTAGDGVEIGEEPAAVMEEPGEPARPRRLVALLLIGLLIVALIVAGYFLIGMIAEGGAGAGAKPARPVLEAEQAGPPPPPPAEAPARAQAPAPAGEGPAGEATQDAASAPAEDAVPAAAEPPPLTGLRRIRWRAEEGVTILVLVGDGRIRPGRVERFRLGGEPPREVIKISGISRPFEPAVLQVGTDQVRRLRTGLHPAADGLELHVVIDLADPGVRVVDVIHRGRRLEVRLGAGAG